LFIDSGEHFGHVDYASDKQFIKYLEDNPVKHRHRPSIPHENLRKFTVQAFDNCDLLSLSTKELK
jgi:hypothetical protein